METFDLDQAFEHYLKLMKIEMKDLSLLQLVELKNAFIGGCGYFMRAMERASENFDDKATMEIFESLESQIADHFQKQVINFQSMWN